MVFGAYLVALVLLLATDLDQRLLPDVITLPAIPLAFVFSLSGLNPLVPVGVLPIAVAVAIAVPLLLWLVSIPFGAGAIGQGDLKLLVSVGLMVGPLRLVYGAIYGALLAGVVLVVLLLLRRITLKTFVPYGPFLDHRRDLGGAGHPVGRTGRAPGSTGVRTPTGHEPGLDCRLVGSPNGAWRRAEAVITSVDPGGPPAAQTGSNVR